MAPQVTFEEEAMRDFLGVAVHAFHRVPFRPGDRVLCIGGGPVGLSLAQVARAHGARQVFVSEIAPVARTVIEQYPGIVCLDPTEVDLAEEVGRASCQVVFDTVGTQETTTQGLELLALGGTYVNLAVHDFTLQLNAMILGAERAMTTSSNARYRDEREAHELIASGRRPMSCSSHTPNRLTRWYLSLMGRREDSDDDGIQSRRRRKVTAARTVIAVA